MTATAVQVHGRTNLGEFPAEVLTGSGSLQPPIRQVACLAGVIVNRHLLSAYCVTDTVLGLWYAVLPPHTPILVILVGLR